MKINIKVIFTLLSLCNVFCDFSFAQGPTLSKVIPPSPNIQAFQKYGNIPVSPYTGIPNISIPLYTVKYRDVSFPISLSYHASGIKVAEEASQVGLGWVINSGGSISRTIIGDDDFNGSVYFNSSTNTLMDFSDGQGPRDNMTDGCILNMFNRNIPNQPTMYTMDLESALNSFPVFDFQPDQYFYNLPGQSGKFILKRNKQAVIEKQEKLQITPAADGSTWQVKTTDGYTYDFNISEKYHDSSDHLSAWYLTKITSPTGNSITFNYTVVPRYVQTVGGYSDSWDYFNPLVQAGKYYAPYTGRQAGSTPGKEYTLVVLDNIDFNTGIVKFNYSDRDDLVGDKKLDNLTIYPKDVNGVVSTTALKTVNLTYDYFDHGNVDNDSGAGTDANSKRLRLLQVQQTGNYQGNTISEKPYVFTYNESVWMPSKGSFARDHWGYYNGKVTNTSLIPSNVTVSSPDMITAYLGLDGSERNADPSVVGAYSLSKIQYPTGGSTELQLEANDFDEQQSQVNDASYFSHAYDIIPQTTTVVYDNPQHKFLPSDTLDLTNAYAFAENPLQATPYIGFNLVIRFNDPSMCNNPYPFPTTDKVTIDIYDINGTNLLVHKDASYFPACSGGNTDGCMVCTGQAMTYNMSNSSLLPGKKYLIRTHVDNAYATSLQDLRMNFSYYAQVSSAANYTTQNNITFSSGGGLRVSRIIDHDGVNPTNINVKKFVYHYFADKNNSGTPKEYSYGRRMSHPVYTYFTITDFVFKYPVTGGAFYEAFTAPSLMRMSDSDIPLNGSAGGAVVGYDQVTVLEGENGENGKTVYQYVNQPDHVNPYNDPEYHLPMQPPFAANLAETLNGSVLKQEDYINKQGQFQIAKRVINTYENYATNDNVVYGVESRVKPHIDIDMSNGSQVSGNSNPCERNLLSYVTLKSQFKPLISTIETTFAQDDITRYAENTTNYYYDNYAHFQPTRITTSNSKGEVTTTVNKYPLDYAISGTVTDATANGVQNLVNKNIVTPVVEKYIKKTNQDGSNSRVTNAVFTSYKTAQPLPDVIQATNSVLPITNFAESAVTASSTTLDSRYKQYIFADQYDNYGNILQQHKFNGPYNSYVWDYNSALPVAEVTNASIANIAYTSFEYDGTGNWTIGSTSRDNTTAKTGKISYNLANGDISKGGLTTSTSYIISYWSKSATPLNITGTVSGYPVNGPATQGWYYHEHKVTGVTSVTVTGSGNIDELRLYPADAQMTTYTYTPLVGITSSTDAKNQTSYYEYDGLLRLINVKDKDGNIVKHTDYHYQGQ
ncbi:hypothetical protein ACFGVS_29080 [Mucilaginibacter sp. AW1-7]|uniref:hypothetical protein n=1 Tax=Mucilaginibacter sp. AW1-7 TaxID=3349874 RepID=UPI003F732634